MATVTILKCPECEEVFSESDAIESRLYECGECGDTYSREQTENNDSRCPDCNKFGARTDSKAGKKGKEAGDVFVCPTCENVELEEGEGFECPICEEVLNSDGDTFAEHLKAEHIDEVVEAYRSERGLL